MAEDCQTTLPDLRHTQSQAAHPAQVESMNHLESPKAVVEQHDCTAAAVERYPVVLDSRPVVAGSGRWPAEPIGSAVAGQRLRTHMALAVGEGVGLVAVQGTHAGPVVWTCQRIYGRCPQADGPTCCPPGIAPYVPGLYPPAACCCGWLHCCWFCCGGGAHWL
jgi:hypothetical protein